MARTSEEWAGIGKGVVRWVVGAIVVINLVPVALAVTGADPDDDFQRGFVYLHVLLGLVLGVLLLGLRAVVRALRRAAPAITKRMLASSLVAGLVVGWPWPSISDLDRAPRGAALLFNTFAILVAGIWWAVAFRRGRRSPRGGVPT